MMMRNSWVSLYLLYLCSSIGVVFANHCYLHSLCQLHEGDGVETSSTVALTTPLSAMYTCMPPGSTGRIDSVHWFYRRLESDTPVEDFPITVDDPRFSISGQSLTIRNLTGDHEAQYYCNITIEGSAPINNNLLGCLVVQGRAYFMNCTGTSEPGGSCTGEEELTVGKGQTARLDMRVGFRNGGICEIQTIRHLQVDRNGVPVYNCSNIVGNQTEACFSTEKYRVDNSQCSADDCATSDLFQCCKFMIFFEIMNVSDSDTGRYTASVTVTDDGSVRREITKSFRVELAPSTSDPGPAPTTGSGSTGMGTGGRSVGTDNVAGITAGVVVGLVVFAALSVAITVGLLFCWHQKKGLWTINNSMDYVAADYEADGGRDQFDMNSTVSGVSKMSLQSRKEKASSVVGPELGFDLPAGRDSEELRI